MGRRASRSLTRRLQRGFTLLDAVFGALIVSVAIFGFIGLCLMMFRMTGNQKDITISYTLARLNIERLKGYGFAYAQEGTSSCWYDKNGQNEATSAFTGATYEVDTKVDSAGKVQTVSGQTTPTDDALRTVTVYVKAYPSGTVLQTWGTLLSKGGA